MTTYQVYCKGTARRWLPYSDEYRTSEEAQACKSWVESLGNYSITGVRIVYKIVRHIRDGQGSTASELSLPTGTQTR